MPRHNYTPNAEPGKPYAIPGSILNEQQDRMQADAKRRGGSSGGTRYLSGTFDGEVMPVRKRVGVFVVRTANWETWTYTGRFRYYDTSVGRWREYPQDIDLDVTGYWTGKQSDPDELSGVTTGANYRSGGPGTGFVPRFRRGEAFAALFVESRNAAVPLIGPPENVCFAYLGYDARTTPGVRVPEVITSMTMPTASNPVSFGSAYLMVNGVDIVDSVHWQFGSDVCCANEVHESSSSNSDNSSQSSQTSQSSRSSQSNSGISSDQSSAFVPGPPIDYSPEGPQAFKQTLHGFATFRVQHRDLIELRVARTDDPSGNVYVDEAAIYAEHMSHVDVISVLSNRLNYALDTGAGAQAGVARASARNVGPWTKYAASESRHANDVTFTPEGSKLRVEMADDATSEAVIRVEYKLTVAFEQDTDLSTSSGSLSESSSSQSQSTSSSLSDLSSTSSVGCCGSMDVVVSSLADKICTTNSYYSNAINGRHTLSPAAIVGSEDCRWTGSTTTAGRVESTIVPTCTCTATAANVDFDLRLFRGANNTYRLDVIIEHLKNGVVVTQTHRWQLALTPKDCNQIGNGDVWTYLGIPTGDQTYCGAGAGDILDVPGSAVYAEETP